MTTPFAFTVKGLAAGLGTEQWRLARVVGTPGGIPATKAGGTGRVGRGGQWRIAADDLLRYARVPESDWPAALDDPEQVLSRIVLLSTIARQEGVPLAWARNVWTRAIQIGVPYGRSDALLPRGISKKTIEILRQERKNS